MSPLDRSPTAKDRVDRDRLCDAFAQVRRASERMCRGLEPADFRVQPQDDVSPPWWNLGHTSWFFARNLLQPFGGEYTVEDRRLDFLLNSYYASLGRRVARGRRGHITRPTTEAIYAYRRSVDRRVEALLTSADEARLAELAPVLEIGIQHEQQHQELFYTEIKAILFENPPEFRPNYCRAAATEPDAEPAAGNRPGQNAKTSGNTIDAIQWLSVDGGLLEFGYRGDGWCWDNELPVHKAYLEDFQIADRLITCGEYLHFIEDGGYRRQLLWLDNGWAEVQRGQWQAPLYWEHDGSEWMIWTLSGMRPLDPGEPVCHVSFYEADAFARWLVESGESAEGVRLPSEYEWEEASRRFSASTEGANLLDTGRLHPRALDAAYRATRPRQMLGDAWEWTSSYYAPYPGYRPFAGALGEYNGKFMDNQRVLRGGSCFTEPEHIRTTYRNFWPAATRFQMSGIRLARSA